MLEKATHNPRKHAPRLSAFQKLVSFAFERACDVLSFANDNV